MSEQDHLQVTTLHRPITNDDNESWIAYWKAHGQPWRTEPEIDVERQKYLAERRNIQSDIIQGIYPFKDIKLSRSDIEWLLATHENGLGPVDWNDKSQHKREGLDLRGADLRQVELHNLPLTCLYGGLHRRNWIETTLAQRTMAEIHLERANLRNAHLEAACLARAHLEGADIENAHLEGADLYRAHLEGATFSNAYLGGTSFRNAYLDIATNLSGIILENEDFGITLTADIHWNDANLAVVNWKQIKVLGEEYVAKQITMWDGQIKNKATWLAGYLSALRANRQLAVALHSQGLNEESDHFAYRAQLLQRKVLWREHEFGGWLFSMLLALLSGYGYRIWRILAAYLLTVSLFALAYFVLGMQYSPHMPLNQAYLESITAFHGRVFFEQFSSNTPQIWLTALEAIAGLIIEGVFIAMLIQRFFGK